MAFTDLHEIELEFEELSHGMHESRNGNGIFVAGWRYAARCQFERDASIPVTASLELHRKRARRAKCGRQSRVYALQVAELEDLRELWYAVRDGRITTKSGVLMRLKRAA